MLYFKGQDQLQQGNVQKIMYSIDAERLQFLIDGCENKVQESQQESQFTW